MSNNIVLVPLDQTDNILKEFFIKDGGITPSGNFRKSVYLAAKKDFLFLRGAGFEKDPFNFSKRDAKTLINNLPSFTAILLYCTVIDLLARIMKKPKIIPRNQSRNYFRWSAKRWFELNYSKVDALWNLRNGMVHQYHLGDNRAVPHGFLGSMRYSKKDKKWEFNLNGMFGDIRKAGKKCYEHIKSKSLPTRRKYASFIYKYGFFYTPIS
ncbi:MAG: hypothetical protein HN981_04370 [Candidatus Pacebacteria bacterium]|jgi:hypothetical protein|nr:hypothetical protein [Candidatus Paceibacterota bacterium]MBT4652481.1 hypothetical protein [Candidatus Paceibacterota bacterium]MBT6756308.1 hypothetical protein [Candidatus Paceibacterota bacterium]MBT6921599.1 hypothetical protein [Candidatus Paceibacterota bacterium]